MYMPEKKGKVKVLKMLIDPFLNSKEGSPCNASYDLGGIHPLMYNTEVSFREIFGTFWILSQQLQREETWSTALIRLRETEKTEQMTRQQFILLAIISIPGDAMFSTSEAMVQVQCCCILYRRLAAIRQPFEHH